MGKNEKIIEILPDVIKNSANWFVDYFNENGKDLIENSSGTIGILLNLFGKPIINKLYEKRTTNKLANYGTETYLEAARRQVSKSLEMIEDQLNNSFTAEEIIEKYNQISNKNCVNITSENIIAVFQPKYHPAVEFVRESQKRLLEELQIKSSTIDVFIIDFNKKIKSQVEQTFGDSYELHLSEINDLIIDEAETKLLIETISAAKIGFDSDENLLYEETFAEWKAVQDLNTKYYIPDDEDPESSLKPISNLINDYFDENKISIENILFVVADFGKGKSVFMKHYAALHARNYIKSHDGYYPIYFNLREYSSYKSNEKLGVISNFLIKKYGYDIEKYKDKKFLFLIDSLDESGDLNENSINEVICSVKKIQNIDPVRCRENRIIISSRPINESLISHMEMHKPLFIKNNEGRPIPNYISIYGFKKEQFNNWLLQTLKQSNNKPLDTKIPLISKILDGILKEELIDVHDELLESKTLSLIELQRPIFAYMIYQLIVKNVDFLNIGKIGIYLSFINLLSRDAKHINDKNIKVNLQKEFEFRNLLEATAALWQFERHRGNQGFLKKADICRVLDGHNIGETDKEILDRYIDVSEIKFLSHSYFGDNNNTLHFQHQSFAEILLAEYYFKVFVRYALDIKTNISECREKLLLGEPTHQTKVFLWELLKLVKETVNNESTNDILEKRKLLFPLFASLATEKNNVLFSRDLYYDWFRKAVIRENETEYPEELLHNWCINEEQIDKILSVCAEILNTKDTYLVTKCEARKNLFENEIILIRSSDLNDIPKNTDKWFALLVGNTLCNNLSNEYEPILFNTKFKINYEIIFELLKNDYSEFDIYIGIDTRRDNYSRIDIDFYVESCNLSYSYLDNISFDHTVALTNFDNSILNNVNFMSYVYSTSFLDTTLKNTFFRTGISNVDFSEVKSIESIYFAGEFNRIRFYSIEDLFSLSNHNKYITKYGYIYVPHRIKELNPEADASMEEISEIIDFIRFFTKIYKKNESFYSDNLNKILKFQDKTVKKVFFRSLLENLSVKEIMEEEKIEYDWI